MFWRQPGRRDVTESMDYFYWALRTIECLGLSLGLSACNQTHYCEFLEGSFNVNLHLDVCETTT
jgi:hypothetical protein